MSGRIINDNKIEDKIDALLDKQPQIIKDYSKSFGNKTTKTKQSYIKRVIGFCSYLQKQNFNLDDYANLCNINYSHIISYMDYTKKFSPNGKRIQKEAGTCAAEFYAIKHFCKYLQLCKYINDNPCDGVEVPKDKKIHEIISLTQEEIDIIKNNINNGVGSNKAKATQEKWKNRDLCLILLGITTGLRVSALSNIDINDIDFINKTLTTIEKGNYERKIFLSDKIIKLINLWLEDRKEIINNIDEKALFISAKNKRINTNTIRTIIKKYTYNINKNITPHKLRSTTATNLYEKTGDIYLVADVLGHHNIQNTKRYASISNAKKEFAADTLSKLI